MLLLWEWPNTGTGWLEIFEDRGDIKNLTGHGAGKNAFGVPASAGCGTR